MNSNLTGAMIQPIMTFIAKAIIRRENYDELMMNRDKIKSHLYDIQGTYRLVPNNQSDRFINAILETYDYLKKIEDFNIENLEIDKSSYYFMKNNNDLFTNDEYEENPLLDDILMEELNDLIA